MAEWKQKRVWWWLSLLFFLCLVLDHKIAQAKRPISSEMENHNKTTFEAYRHLFANAFGALFEPGDSTTRVWPVASATSTFAMTFSSSMSVIQYYLLDRFPVPYASYFVFLATVAAFTGQHIVRKLIVLLGRASLIIFILALTIFVSAISLGGVGIANMVEKLDRKDHIGFENLCYRT